MAWLTRTLHQAGLLVGLYTDAGSEGCGGLRQGSYGHYRQDANTFAAWGFDAVKVDFCGGVRRKLDPKAAYASFHEALVANSSRRPMLLSICNFLEPGQFQGQPPFAQSAFASYTFGPSTGNSWRTDTDVGSPGHVTFATVLRNLDADAAHPEAAGPGHWNDPDYLGPDQGLTAGQFQAQLSMWAILAAPLMVSDDLESASTTALAQLTNRELVAIDQDAAGQQGTLLATEGEGQVWVKPLRDGSKALALLNRGPTPIRLETSAAALGLAPSARYRVRDVWARTTRATSGAIAAEVPGESAELLRVSASDEGSHA
jgi:alpha-galactosidase